MNAIMKVLVGVSMIRLKKLTFLFIGAIVFGNACSQNNFAGRSVAGGKKSQSAATAAAEPGPKVDPLDQLEVETGDSTNDPTACLFAVSGSHFGYAMRNTRNPDKYGSKFPKTSSGRPTKHLEKFDITGGVYLQASEAPYEYQKGEKEIDQAVNDSFDSIAIPPGLEVEIRSGNGTVLFKGEGPYMAFNQYDNPGALAANFLRDFASKVPADHWMKKYLGSKNYLLGTVALAQYGSDPSNKDNAHYVKVNKLPGVKCDSY